MRTNDTFGDGALAGATYVGFSRTTNHNRSGVLWPRDNRGSVIGQEAITQLAGRPADGTTTAEQERATDSRALPASAQRFPELRAERQFDLTMRILAVHEYYQQRGGEDSVFEAEARLLERKLNHVTRFTVHNRQIAGMNGISAGLVTLWNPSVYAELRRVIRSVGPEIVHFHNTFPLLSPAVYYAAKREHVAVVQTLHNFRLLCSNGLLLRDGMICEDCIGKTVPWPGLLHRCYRHDRLASAAVMTMQALHRALGTWRKRVDRFIAPSDFLREKLAEGGLVRERIIVKPHFVDPDPRPGDGAGGFLLFVGRLSGEKGVATLLRAWQRDGLLPPLRIVGDGPMSNEVRVVSAELSQVAWLGPLPWTDVLDLVGSARFLIVPSTCYESFSSVVAESFAKGTPVIASRHGALAENVSEGHNGFLFSPGDHSDLARTIVRAWHLGEDEYRTQRTKARAAYERYYTAERNYGILCDIYQQAIGAARSSRKRFP